jgi:hypothetical protein
VDLVFAGSETFGYALDDALSAADRGRVALDGQEDAHRSARDVVADVGGRQTAAAEPDDEKHQTAI